MSDNYVFSKESEEYLKRCLALKRPLDSDNKWIKRFKKIDENLVKSAKLCDENINSNIIEICESDIEAAKIESPRTTDSELSDEFLEIIELEPVSKFDFMVQECEKNPKTLIKLAEYLSLNTIEKICNILFFKTDVNSKFLEQFYTTFLPTIIKRENSRFCLDLLVNANRTHQLEFKKLINVILKDLDISNTILNDFARVLDEVGKLELLNKIVEADLTLQEFQHNLSTIITAYKDSKKNLQLQKCMEKILILNSDYCSKDKNFGKLFLAFLQEQKNYGPFQENGLVEKAIEINKTPFKKPCQNIFKIIIEAHNDSVIN